MDDFDIKPARRIDTAKFIFRTLSPDPQKPITLHVRALGADNAPYMDAVFKRKGKADADRPGSLITAEARDQDLSDIAHYAVESWDNVIFAGKAAECTPEKVLAFLKRALASGYVEEINELRVFVQMPSNFREALPAASDLGKK